MTGRFLIYGATGYTGRLIARAANAAGMKPLLAARNRARLEQVALEERLECRTIPLDDPGALHSGLSEVDLVLHVAGPFSQTSKPMLDACVRARKHYLDITGEIDVFEACASRDEQAREAEIMVMPGVGFDIVPSDCLAAHMQQRMVDAVSLTLAIAGPNRMSRGTAKTAIESLGKGTRIRRDGRIVALPVPPRRIFEYNQDRWPAVGVGWGDVSTAYYSTGIPNVAVYFEASRELEQFARLSRPMRWLLGRTPIQRVLMKLVDLRPEGPTEAERNTGHATLLAEVVNARDAKAVGRLQTPEGYSLTVMTSLEIVRRVLAGAIKVGFQTPSQVFGADFITQFSGCRLEDLKIA